MSETKKDFRTQYEREQDALSDDYADGLISREEYNERMRQLARDEREDAIEAAQRAYDDVLENW